MWIYICGPMSGLSDLNFPAFDKARDKLTAEGHRVVSPADLERERDSFSYEEALQDDFRHLIECDAIYILRGWRQSRGARVEKAIAEVLGMKIIYQSPYQR
jgi:hypothetical protein